MEIPNKPLGQLNILGGSWKNYTHVLKKQILKSKWMHGVNLPGVRKHITSTLVCAAINDGELPYTLYKPYVSIFGALIGQDYLYMKS